MKNIENKQQNLNRVEKKEIKESAIVSGLRKSFKAAIKTAVMTTGLFVLPGCGGGGGGGGGAPAPAPNNSIAVKAAPGLSVSLINKADGQKFDANVSYKSGAYTAEVPAGVDVYMELKNKSQEFLTIIDPDESKNQNESSEGIKTATVFQGLVDRYLLTNTDKTEDEIKLNVAKSLGVTSFDQLTSAHEDRLNAFLKIINDDPDVLGSKSKVKRDVSQVLDPLTATFNNLMDHIATNDTPIFSEQGITELAQSISDIDDAKKTVLNIVSRKQIVTNDLVNYLNKVTEKVGAAAGQISASQAQKAALLNQNQNFANVDFQSLVDSTDYTKVENDYAAIETELGKLIDVSVLNTTQLVEVFEKLDGNLKADDLTTITGQTPVNPVDNLNQISKEVDAGLRILTESFTLDEDIALTTTISIEGSEGKTLSLSATANPSHGSVEILEGLSFKYTPDNNYFGSDAVTFEISDGTNTITKTFNINVSPVNDLPTVSIEDVYTVDEEGVLTISPSISDIEGEAVSLSIKNSANNGEINVNGSEISYEPNLNFFGQDAFVIDFTDESGGKVTKTFTVNVNNVNDLPVVTVDTVYTIDEEGILTISPSISDADSEAVSLATETNSLHGQLSYNGSEIRYEAFEDYVGSDTFTVSFTDESGAKVTRTFNLTIENVNDLPVVTVDTVYTIDEQGTLNITPTIVDVDNEVVSSIITNNATHGTLTLNGNNIEYTANEDYFGSDTFTVKYADQSGGEVTKTYEITINNVNDAPVITVDTAYTIDEEGTLNIVPTITDVENDSVSSVVINNAANGTVTLSGNNIEYTANKDYVGSDTFTVKYADIHGAEVTKVYMLTINNVNDLPEVTVDTTYTMNEDGTLSITPTVLDVDGETVTASTASAPSHGTVTYSGTNINYEPNDNYFGTDSFTVDFTDASGAKVTKTFELTINNVNDLPEVTVNTMYTINEDDTVTITPNITEIEGETVTLSTASAPSNGTVTYSGTNITYEPNENYFGSDTFTVDFTDASGGKVTRTFNVNMNSVNDLPTVTVDTTHTMNEEGTLSITPTISDIESETVSPSTASAPSNGTVTYSGTNITYEPNKDYFGSDTFTVDFTDASGGKVTKTFNITINNVNDLPEVTVDTVYTMNEDGTLSITPTVTDIESETVTPSTSSAPSHGTVTYSGTNITYTPTANYNGSDTFTTDFTDASGGKVTKTFNVTINAVDDPITSQNASLGTHPEYGSAAKTITTSDLIGASYLNLQDVDSPLPTSLDVLAIRANGASVKLDGVDLTTGTSKLPIGSNHSLTIDPQSNIGNIEIDVKVGTDTRTITLESTNVAFSFANFSSLKPIFSDSSQVSQDALVLDNNQTQSFTITIPANEFVSSDIGSKITSEIISDSDGVSTNNLSLSLSGTTLTVQATGVNSDSVNKYDTVKLSFKDDDNTTKDVYFRVRVNRKAAGGGPGI